MKTSPFLINLIIYGPYVILLLLFIIFFYRAIRFHGITKLKKFTVVMLGVFVVAFALRFFRVNFFDWIPIQFLKVAGDGNTTNLLIMLMMIFFVISITKIRSEKHPKLLTTNWLVIALFSAAYIGWLVYLYILWKEPAGRLAYMKQMIYPALWVLAASLSLWKIKKEKRRLVYG